MDLEPPHASAGSVSPLAAGSSPLSGLLDPHSRDPGVQRELAQWLRLQAALGLRPQLAADLLRQTGSPVAALRRSPHACPLGPKAVAAQLATLRRFDVKALPLLAPAYPPRLARLCDPAALLWLRGGADPELLSRPAVGIVGARAATAYGLEVARTLAMDLAEAGVVVISGLARGIDAAAHAGALAAGGLTVAVQACGPDRIYPRQNRALAEGIAQRGLLATEMAPGTPPLRAYFPLRNRLIAALAGVVVVVEARLRSGSLVTARHALDQGGEVMAVPGPVGRPTSEGANRLIQDGARPVLQAADVLAELGIQQVSAKPGDAESDRREPAEPAARRVLAELRREPASRDALALRLGVAPAALARVLLEMELAGWLRTDRDGRLVAALRPPSSAANPGPPGKR